MSNLIKCKDCGKDVSKNANSCPNCGAKVPKPNILMAVIIGLFGLFLICGIVSNATKSISSSSTTSSAQSVLETIAANNSSNLELLPGYNATRGEYGNVEIVGKVKNNGSKEFSYVQVTFNLYDASGAQIGSAMANVNNLEPQGIWKFSAACLEDNFKTFKFKDITGY